MAFDPAKPSGHGPLSSADMRDQLNALKALLDGQQAQIADLQQQLSPLVPGLAFDAATSLWNVTCPGPGPAQWVVWKRCDYAPVWSVKGPVDFPAQKDEVLDMDEVWGPVKGGGGPRRETQGSRLH